MSARPLLQPPSHQELPGDLPHLPVCVCLNSDVPAVPGITLHCADAEQLPLLTILLHKDAESPCMGQGDAEWCRAACPWKGRHSAQDTQPVLSGGHGSGHAGLTWSCGTQLVPESQALGRRRALIQRRAECGHVPHGQRVLAGIHHHVMSWRERSPSAVIAPCLALLGGTGLRGQPPYGWGPWAERCSHTGRAGSSVPRAPGTCGSAGGVVSHGASGDAGAAALPVPLPTACQPAGARLEGAGELGSAGTRRQRHVIQCHVTHKAVPQRLEGQLPPGQTAASEQPGLRAPAQRPGPAQPRGTAHPLPSPGTAAAPWQGALPARGATRCPGCPAGSTAPSPPLPAAAA